MRLIKCQIIHSNELDCYGFWFSLKLFPTQTQIFKIVFVVLVQRNKVKLLIETHELCVQFYC